MKWTHKEGNKVLVRNNVRLYCIVCSIDVSIFCNIGSITCTVVYFIIYTICPISYTISSIIRTISYRTCEEDSLIGTGIMKTIEK